MVQVNPSIFRQYDVRGIVGKDLTLEVVEELGKGYGTYMRRHGYKRVSLGYDARPSSPEFCEAITRGMVSTGLDVVQIGLVATPMLYFSLFHLDVDGGVMITGSHNPPEFNGFKLGMGKTTLYGEQIQAIREIIERGEYEQGEGSVSQEDIGPAYLQMLIEKVGPFARAVKVVVDAGNGCGALYGPKALRELGAEVIELYCEVDGTFPNHHPDPTVPEYLTDLIAKVKETGAEVGIAWDGDADRIGVVTPQGRIVWGDQLMALFSREVLAKNPGATIIFEVKSSQALAEEIERLGGRPLMWKTGHSLIKAKMKEEHAPLAGEMSGHLFFADEFFGFDDAVYASCRIVRFLAAQERSLDELVDELPHYYSTPEIRVDCPDDRKFAVVEEVGRYFKAHYDVIDVDGIRVQFGDGWGLLRASNTQPVLVLRFEARTPERLEEIKRMVVERLREVEPSIQVP